jgi:hypothetical protein
MSDRLFRALSVAFLAGVVVHGVDHLRRGTGAVTTYVLVAGTVQFVLASLAVVLVFRRDHRAPIAALAVGLPGALGFAAVHLLPYWGPVSDSFVGAHAGPGVTAFSWVTALLEIAGDLAFATAGLVILQGRGGRGLAASTDRPVEPVSS